MRAMVVLVGRQPLPNLIPIKHLRPGWVCFVYTDASRAVYEHTAALVRRMGIETHGLLVDAYDVAGTSAALSALILPLTREAVSVTINLTGGTKTMVLAAFQVARRGDFPVLYLNSEQDPMVLYRYGWRDGELSQVQAETPLVDVTIAEYLDAHLGPGAWHHGELDLANAGGAFESAVASTLRECADEVVTSIRLLGGSTEVDMLARTGSRFAIFEVKSGQSGRRADGIKQLSSVAKSLSIYTALYYVIEVEMEKSQQMLVDSHGVQVVSLGAHRSEPCRLEAEDDARLTAAALRTLGSPAGTHR